MDQLVNPRRRWGFGDRRIRLTLLATGFALLLAGGPVVAQQGVVSREYTIKAGVISVLGRCVTWPSDKAPTPGQPLTIGVLGEDPFNENGVNQLDRIAAEMNAKGVATVVRRFGSADDYQPCHILFVARTGDVAGVGQKAADRLAAAAKLANGATVLIVGEDAGLARQGAAANLIYDRDTNLIRLEINPDAASRAGLKLSPDLLRLKLVQIVRDSPS